MTIWMTIYDKMDDMASMWQYGWQYMTEWMIVLIKSDNMDDIANKWQYMTKWMIVLRKCDNMDGSANMWQYGWHYMTIWMIVLIKSWEVGVELRSRNVREYYRVQKYFLRKKIIWKKKNRDLWQPWKTLVFGPHDCANLWKAVNRIRIIMGKFCCTQIRSSTSFSSERENIFCKGRSQKIKMEI